MNYRTIFAQKFSEKTNLYSFLIIVFLSFSTSANTQVTLSLTYTEKNNLTTIETGATYTIQLNYAVSSTTGNASGVKIDIPMPDYVFSVRDFIGTTHAPIANFVFNNTVGAKKLTINFVNPVPSGSNGVLEFSIITQNLTTPNNTILTTNAELTATGGYTSGVKTNDMLLTAIPRICATKTLLNGGAIGFNTTYRIAVRTGGYANSAPYGTLQATNITIKDTLPAGATFVSANVYNMANGGSFVGTGSISGGVVTAAMPNLSYSVYGYDHVWQAMSYYVDITVRFDSPTFSAGNTVVNKAIVNYTPFSQSATTLVDGQTVGNCTSDLIETTTLVAPTITAILTKAGSGSYYPNNLITYDIGFNNTGNVELNNVEIIDSIPSNLRIDQTAAYRGVRIDARGYLNHVEYQTNLNASWVSFTPSGLNVVPLLPLGEYFTKLKFVLITPFPANTTLNGYNQLYFVGTSAPVTPETVTNCLVWSSTTSGIPNLGSRTVCNGSVTLLPRPATSKTYYSISNTPSCINNLVIGQNLTFTGTVVADAGYSDVQNPISAMLVPHGFDFVSQSFGVSTSGIATAPTLQIIPNYVIIGGVAKDLYRWAFPSGTTLAYSKNFTVAATLKVTAALLPTTDYTVDFIATGSNTSVNTPQYNYGNLTDTNDWDLDGNTTETIGRANNNYCCYTCHVSASASMESIKWVKGLADTAYSRYPAFGQTVPGGNADYQLIVKNTGNVSMKDVKIIDLLPFFGDVGVIDPTARSTQWRPNLAGPITAPSGISVYYTTVLKPCRDEVKQPNAASPFPAGCSAPNWSTTPPIDLTKVQAVKIDFGATVLAGADSLVFNWPMRAPVNAPTNNEIAWNSFGFVATRTDNNQPLLAAEPIKVGIKVQAGAPAYYGDRVWFDTNHNGIQDNTEGGVDGIKVKLFTPRVSGVQTPTTDSLVNFTITGNGGLYIFTNLKPADYYAVFCLPNGYFVSPKNASGSTADTDSDGTTTTYDGGTATMTPITNLTVVETDLSWDQGIYCSITPTVTGIQQVLAGSSVTLTATGGTAYSWSGPNGFSATTASITINNVNPLDTGTYIVSIADGACFASLSTKIEFYTCTQPSSIGITQIAPDCANNTANNNGKITLTAVNNADKYGISSGTVYTGAAYSTATNIGALPIDVQTGIPNTGGTYTIRLFNSLNTCHKDTIISQSAVLVPTAPSVSASVSNACPATSVNLLNISAALAPSVSGSIFEWHVGNTSSSAFVSNPSSVGAGVYYLFEHSPAGCYSTGTAVTVTTVSCCPPQSCIQLTIARH